MIEDRSAADSSLVIEVADFRKSYRSWFRSREAVKGVNLTVRRGELFGIIGPDGAGKSSLLKAIAGVLTYDAGAIDVLGVKIDSEANADRIKGRIGFMPQGLGKNLYPSLSVDENIEFFAELRLVPPHELARRRDRLLQMTRMLEFRSRPMNKLSGGMKQKLGLACALIHDPELVILDEPTTGVDPVSRQEFWRILGHMSREQGITALVSTAYLDEAARFNRMAMMYAGRILHSGPPDSILASVPGSVVVVRSTNQWQAFQILTASLEHVEAVGNEIRVFVRDQSPKDARCFVAKLLAELQIEEINVQQHDLKDVFVAIVKEETNRPSTNQASNESIAIQASQNAASHTDHSSTEYAIEANKLVKTYGEFRAVNEVSFKVRQGEIFGLLGANGAGKTTCIKILTGILEPTHGSGNVAGVDMRNPGRQIKERIGYVSQAFSLYQDLSVIDNIHLYAGIYGLFGAHLRNRVQWVLETIGLRGHESELAGRLPIGLRQRLALGCAVTHSPGVLFLDEPTSGVDPIGRRSFWRLLFQLSRDDNVAILVTTHHLGEAEYCDRIGLMYSGRLVDDASPAELKACTAREVGALMCINTSKPLEALDILERANLKGGALFGNSVRLFWNESTRQQNELSDLFAKSSIDIQSITPIPISLEDAFVHRVRSLESEESGLEDS